MVPREQGADFHRARVRDALQIGDYKQARGAFASWIEMLKQLHGVKAGESHPIVDEAKQAFSKFVRLDPLYLRLVEIVVGAIQKQPGVLQTQLYSQFADVPKEDLMYVLYFAEDHGRIMRAKKGRTFSLFLPKDYEPTLTSKQRKALENFEVKLVS